MSEQEFIEILAPIRLKKQKKATSFRERFRYAIVESPFIWETTEDMEFVLRDGSKITVPAGFETDLCSVPPILSGFMRPYPSTVKAYILHDYLYVNDIRRTEMGDKANKKWCDEEMLHQANLINPNMKLDNKLRFLAVKYFGKKVYERSPNKEQNII